MVTEGQASQKLKILGIFAHPHDCVHALGTCGNHIAGGDSAGIVILTDGGATHNERLWAELQKPPEQRDPKIAGQSRQEYTAQKEQEVREACSYFGITDVRVLGYEDRPIRRTDEMVEALVNIMCEVRPDILIGELPEHQRDNRLWVAPNDHTTCAAIVQEAVTIASLARAGTDRVPHRIARMYYLATEKAYDKVDIYIDISDQYENRLKAEMCYVSQSHTPEFARVRLERTIGHAGWRADVAYAETFFRGNMDVLDRLPVTDRDLLMAREPDVIARMLRGVRWPASDVRE